MLRDETDFPQVHRLRLIVGVAAGRHNVIQLLTFQELFKYVRSLVDDVLVSRCTRDIAHRMMRLASLNALVAAMDLGPGLLKQYDPDLGSVTLRECRSTIANGYEVIDDNLDW